MQYYSKSPKQLQQEREAAAEKSNRKFSRGRVILLIDVILVILIILFYQSSLKDIFTSRQDTMKNFEWKSYTVEAGCLKEGNCHIQIKGGGLQNISPLKWQLKDEKGELILEETQVLQRSETEGVEMLSGRYQISSEQGGAQLYVQLSDESTKEQITFRVFP